MVRRNSNGVFACYVVGRSYYATPRANQAKRARLYANQGTTTGGRAFAVLEFVNNAPRGVADLRKIR